MVNEKDKNKKKLAWVTGASTGIGRAAALRLAQQGWDVAATARSEDKLEDLAANLSAFKGRIFPYPGDVTDLAAMRAVVEKIEGDHGPIDLALLNAGGHFPDKPGCFSAEHFRKTFDLNVYGTAHCLEPVWERFRARQSGHVAIVASVAGFRGLPQALSYCPSKAALINLSECLALDGASYGIKVQVINPGFVKTPLTDKNKFPMPMLMDVNAAADVLVKGLSSDRFEINFPWPFVYAVKLMGMLPNRAYLWLMKKMAPGVLE
ncbi:MAG: SDR family NAD(P)-dependent oxidoreductase [Alphaproteobacteria bacterium]|nr:SDR family NAD(P)-dependent oxidoreductase [Alphaproteobacteria bacterium]MCD8571494.1 SDR family NAD(P)-dependent oxidoreductase [Alphaproteobacteria bacterium]